MVRDIVVYGAEVLRRKCPAVGQVTAEISTLAEDLIETMHAAEGIGLAAPQVGVALQMAVVDVRDAPEPMTYLRVDGADTAVADLCPLVFMNPKLEFPTKDKGSMNEGCLSFPDLRAPVSRPNEVRATLQLLDGRTVILETDGLFSRAIQHETDHLMGVLFIDRTTAAAKVTLKTKIRMMQDEWGDAWTPGLEEV